MNDEQFKLIDTIAAAFRAAGQPDIKNLVFICEEGSEFQGFDSILGIPVYTVPFLDVRGGLMLACTANTYTWETIGSKINKFQKELEN